MKKTNEKKQEKKTEKIVGTICDDVRCPFHGNLKVRGKIFEGIVTKKFPKRVVIEFERRVYSRKYERYFKANTKIHAKLPDCMANEIEIGDLIRAQECRPLSKIIHFVVIKKIKGADEK
jgi:small subunit ribosomal protein S17